MEGMKRFVVGNGNILRSAGILEPCVLRADAGIIQPRRDRMRLDDLYLFVLDQIGAVAVQNAGLACTQGSGMLARGESESTGLHADQAYVTVFDIGIESTDCVRTAADASEYGIGLASDRL